MFGDITRFLLDTIFSLFGAALLHALITAPTGVAGQLTGLITRIGRRIRRTTP